MKTLFVSFDCGLNYQEFMKSESTEELLSRTRDPYIACRRWYIEDETGELDMDNLCPIHRQIINLLIKYGRGSDQ